MGHPGGLPDPSKGDARRARRGGSWPRPSRQVTPAHGAFRPQALWREQGGPETRPRRSVPRAPHPAPPGPRKPRAAPRGRLRQGTEPLGACRERCDTGGPARQPSPAAQGSRGPAPCSAAARGEEARAGSSQPRGPHRALPTPPPAAALPAPTAACPESADAAAQGLGCSRRRRVGSMMLRVTPDNGGSTNRKRPSRPGRSAEQSRKRPSRPGGRHGSSEAAAARGRGPVAPAQGCRVPGDTRTPPAPREHRLEALCFLRIPKEDRNSLLSSSSFFLEDARQAMPVTGAELGPSCLLTAGSCR